jgi:hypothetical protein
MMDYQPKLWHVFEALIFGAVFFYASIYWSAAQEWLVVEGLLCWGCVLLIWVRMIMDTRRQFLDAQTKWFEQLRQMDPEQWRALGLINPPVINVTWEGETVIVWEGVVPMKYFDHFLRTSNDSQTSPKRDWNTKEYPERMWISIYERLVQLGYVIPDSADGNRSYRWRTGMCGEAWRRYLTPDLHEIPSPTRNHTQFDHRTAPEAQIEGTERDIP